MDINFILQLYIKYIILFNECSINSSKFHLEKELK